MSGLKEYLVQKRESLAQRLARIGRGEVQPAVLRASVSAEGRSGVRRIRIRDFQIISDSPPDFAGYNLGPSSPELQLGVLGSCLTHSYLIQAAAQNVPLESLEVEVSAVLDARSGHPDHADVPVYPQTISYSVNIVSQAGPEQIKALEEAVERFCPILNLLKNPQKISGTVNLQAVAQAA